MRKTGIASIVLLATLWSVDCRAAENPVLVALTKQGLAVSPSEVVRLPPIVLADGLDAAAQRQAIEAATGGKYSWDALTRNSVVAPFVLKQGQEETDSDRIGRRADVYFIVHTDMKTIGKDEFLTGQFSSSGSEPPAEGAGYIRLLTHAELAKRKLPAPRSISDPRYVTARFNLLERVQISATTRSVRTDESDSIIVATVLDTRFADDPDFPNSWRPISRDDAGQRQIGERHPYAGFGTYAKVTRLADPKGALFVEYHVAFAEPKGWFNGANLLRSKLPLIAQELVRDLRRRVETEP